MTKTLSRSLLLFGFALSVPAARADVFDFGPRHRVSFSAGGDSDNARFYSLDANVALPKDWSLNLGGGTRGLELQGEEVRSKSGYLGLATDPLDAWVFDGSIDRETQDDLFTDDGYFVRAIWQPIHGPVAGWAFWFGYGRRDFRFTRQTLIAGRDPNVRVDSKLFRFGFDAPLGRDWAVMIEGERRDFPDEIKDFDLEIVALLVPSGTLAHSFALPETAGSVAVSWSPRFWRRVKPNFRLSGIRSEAAVDGAESGTLAFDFGVNLTPAWRVTLSAAGTKSTGVSAEATSDDVLTSSLVAFAYSWR